jgi:adenine-specific DNA-methyltransferase
LLVSLIPSLNYDFCKRSIRTLFDDVKVFNNPKPISLLEKYFSFILKDNDIILDFFAGSASTAHAIMALNAEAIKNSENHKFGNRKFIMVQIPEDIDPESKDYKSAYEFCVNNNMPPNIAEISKERIRRAAAHITSELPESVDSKALDFGFKAYTLADSNFIPWQQPASYDADSLMAQLEKHLDPIVDTATTDGIITELMLKEGYTLTADVIEVDGYYLVTQNDALIDNFDADSSDNAGTSMRLAIVLDDMTTSKATQIIARAPNKTLIMDRAFSDDANKANIVLQFEDAGLVVGCV